MHPAPPLPPSPSAPLRAGALHGTSRPLQPPTTRKRQRTLHAAPEAGAVTLAETQEMQGSHPISPRSSCERSFRGTSLEVQSLKLHVSNVGEVGSIPGQGTKIAHATRCSKKKLFNCHKVCVGALNHSKKIKRYRL